MSKYALSLLVLVTVFLTLVAGTLATAPTTLPARAHSPVIARVALIAQADGELGPTPTPTPDLGGPGTGGSGGGH
jgi:hypothetical protein